jgi:hypothetical protein
VLVALVWCAGVGVLVMNLLHFCWLCPNGFAADLVFTGVFWCFRLGV